MGGGIDAGAWRPWRRNGDRALSLQGLGSISCRRLERTTRRNFGWLQNGEGWSGAAAPWRGVGGGGLLAHREKGNEGDEEEIGGGAREEMV
jgi:hypothetical protein